MSFRRRQTQKLPAFFHPDCGPEMSKPSLLVLESHQIGTRRAALSRQTARGRGLYRQSGVSPCPEDLFRCSIFLRETRHRAKAVRRLSRGDATKRHRMKNVPRGSVVIRTRGEKRVPRFRPFLSYAGAGALSTLFWEILREIFAVGPVFCVSVSLSAPVLPACRPRWPRRQRRRPLARRRGRCSRASARRPCTSAPVRLRFRRCRCSSAR